MHQCDSRHLQVNSTKTEVMWVGTTANLQKMEVNNDYQSGASWSNLFMLYGISAFTSTAGCWLTLQKHVSNISRTCFCHMRRLRSIRKQIGREPMAWLVSAFVLSRLDYCNAILAGLTLTLAPLQRVQNDAARLVLDLKPRDHLTSAYHQLHWLPVRQRSEYKLCLLTHLAVTGKSPAYLASLLTTTKSRGSTSRSAEETCLSLGQD